MDSANIQASLDRAVAQGAAAGVSAATLDPQGGIRTFNAGTRGVADATPMDPSTMFWIASCTKAIVSAAALQLVDQGKLDLDEPVGRLLPEFAQPQVLDGFDAKGQPVLRAARRPVTLRALLTHTSGMAYDWFNAPLAQYFATTGLSLFGVGWAAAPLVFEPGDGWQYGTSIDAVGLLVEAAAGRSLGDQLAQAIFQPLGMADTTFAPTTEQSARMAGMHARTPDGGLAPADPFPPASREFQGGGGLYSTAADYLKFLRAVARGGEGVFSPAVMTMLTAPQPSPSNVGQIASVAPPISADFTPMPGVEKAWTLAFLQNVRPLDGARAAGSLAWAGLANCYYWVDPASGVAGALFTQIMPFADARVLGAFEAFERAAYAPARAAAPAC